MFGVKQLMSECICALPIASSRKPQLSTVMLHAPGSAGLQPPSPEPTDITPRKGGSRWDIATALPAAELNIKHLAEGSGVLTAQEVCHGGMAK